MKLLALDIGDVWTGTATTDALGMFAKPYKTLETSALIAGLQDIFSKEKIQKTKEDKIKSQSIAAAFILENYLQFTRVIQEEE